MSAALLPCPFCGGDASLGTMEYARPQELLDGRFQTLFYFVNCERCGADNRGLVGRVSAEAAAEHWNRRSAPLAGDTDTREDRNGD